VILNSVVQFGGVLAGYASAYICASRFLDGLGFRGDVIVEVQLMNVFKRNIMFIQTGNYPVETFTNFDEVLTASQVVSAENLWTAHPTVSQELFSQLCWSCWQSPADFPKALHQKYLAASLAGLGMR
jgi:hypothetical protein